MSLTQTNEIENHNKADPALKLYFRSSGRRRYPFVAARPSIRCLRISRCLLVMTVLDQVIRGLLGTRGRITPGHAIGRTEMTRQELDAALARLGLDVPEKERDEIAAAAHLVEDMVARLRPVGGRDVAAEPAHVVRFPEG